MGWPLRDPGLYFPLDRPKGLHLFQSFSTYRARLDPLPSNSLGTFALQLSYASRCCTVRQKRVVLVMFAFIADEIFPARKTGLRRATHKPRLRIAFLDPTHSPPKPAGNREAGRSQVESEISDEVESVCYGDSGAAGLCYRLNGENA